MMNQKHFQIFLTALSMLAVMATVGCRSTGNIPASSAADYSGQTLQARFNSVARSYGEWSQINLPLRVDIKSPMSISASGRAYMRRGQDIFISMRVFGMEVATLYVNSDSIFAADKFNKRYLAEPIGKILSDASVSVSDIQDILLGRPFVNSRGTMTTDMLTAIKLSENGSSWTVTPQNKVAGANYSFVFSKSSNTLEAFEVTTSGRTVSCRYSDRADTPSGPMMRQAAISTSVGGKEIDVALRFSLESAKWEVGESIGWKTPKNYNRIDGATLIGGLAK